MYRDEEKKCLNDRIEKTSVMECGRFRFEFWGWYFSQNKFSVF